MINGDDEATITKVAIIVEKNQAEERNEYISQQFEIHGPTEYKFQNGRA